MNMDSCHTDKARVIHLGVIFSVINLYALFPVLCKGNHVADLANEMWGSVRKLIGACLVLSKDINGLAINFSGFLELGQL